MITKLIDELSKYIKSVEIDGNTIINNSKNIKIVEVLNKYSSVKKPTIKIKANDKLCKRDDRLTYICPMCNSLSSVLVGRFLAKKSKYCYKCKENNEEKRKKQSEFIIKSYSNFNKVKPKEKLKKLNIIELSKISFDNETDQFKQGYFKRNLTVEESKIKYNFNGDLKFYKVDFEIPTLRHLIEIKGDHIWHKEQVKSGKWKAKELAARDWCSNRNYTYKIVFDLNEYIDLLSLNKFENWNPVLNQKVLDFIETNKTNLLNLWDKEKSEEDNMEFLINYFTENPDLMNNSPYLNNVTTVLPKSGLRNNPPILQNIGGVKDFKSF